jgi:hypothetical protein
MQALILLVDPETKPEIPDCEVVTLKGRPISILLGYGKYGSCIGTTGSFGGVHTHKYEKLPLFIVWPKGRITSSIVSDILDSKVEYFSVQDGNVEFYSTLLRDRLAPTEDEMFQWYDRDRPKSFCTIC